MYWPSQRALSSLRKHARQSTSPILARTTRPVRELTACLPVICALVVLQSHRLSCGRGASG